MRPTSNTIVFTCNGETLRTIRIGAPTRGNIKSLVSHLRELRRAYGTAVKWETIKGFE